MNEIEWPGVTKLRRLTREQIARQLADVAADLDSFLLPEARP